MNQFDMFPTPRTPLDEAIDTLASPSIEWIIRPVISSAAAVLLKKFRHEPRISKSEMKALRKFGSSSPLRELCMRGCLRYSSRKPEIRMQLMERNIMRSADETNRRLDEWMEREAASLGTDEIERLTVRAKGIMDEADRRLEALQADA